MPNLPLHLPTPPVLTVVHDSRIDAIQTKLREFPTFAAYEQLAAIYVEHHHYEEAAKALRTEAAMYRARHLEDAAIIKENRASSYVTDVRLYADRPLTAAESAALDTHAPLEPAAGCYIGAFIDHDDNLPDKYVDENWQTHRTAEELEQRVGKPHASLFMYLHYGQKFPEKWIQDCKEHGVIPHIAWEPDDLTTVRDDDYLRGFAQACHDADWPIFFRFASEMNGFWTPYHRDPKLYRQKFKLVHQVLHRYADKVATIWCVNNPPLTNIQSYYPGDDACDWVGVNFYSVPFHENKASQPAFDESPLTLLDPIYHAFAMRKPIAICEYAASHMAVVDHKVRPQFAVEKMALLFGALPRLYPRVKLIDWFDMDTVRYPSPGKTLNDYTFTGNETVLHAYARDISSPYYRGEPEPTASPPLTMPRPLVAGQHLSGVAHLSIWVRSYVPQPVVVLQVGQRVVYAGRKPGAHVIRVDTSGLPAGAQPATVYVYDNQNRFVALRRVAVNVVPS